MQTYTQFFNNDFFNAIDEFGFPSDTIKAIMFDHTSEEIGIGGSFVLKYLLEKKNGIKEDWKASDIDFFVTDYSILKKFYDKFSWYPMTLFTIDDNTEYSTMNGISHVLEIYGDNNNRKIQVVVIDYDTIEGHINDIDLEFTKILFSKERGYHGTDFFNAIETRSCNFPNKFTNIRHFIKVWFRAEKYKKRGFTINYPKKITLENVIYYNGKDYRIPESIKKKYEKIVDGKFFMFKERKPLKLVSSKKKKKVVNFDIDDPTFISNQQEENYIAEINELKNQLSLSKEENTNLQDKISKMGHGIEKYLSNTMGLKEKNIKLDEEKQTLIKTNNELIQTNQSLIDTNQKLSVEIEEFKSKESGINSTLEEEKNELQKKLKTYEMMMSEIKTLVRQ